MSSIWEVIFTHSHIQWHMYPILKCVNKEVKQAIISVSILNTNKIRNNQYNHVVNKTSSKLDEFLKPTSSVKKKYKLNDNDLLNIDSTMHYVPILKQYCYYYNVKDVIVYTCLKHKINDVSELRKYKSRRSSRIYKCIQLMNEIGINNHSSQRSLCHTNEMYSYIRNGKCSLRRLRKIMYEWFSFETWYKTIQHDSGFEHFEYYFQSYMIEKEYTKQMILTDIHEHLIRKQRGLIFDIKIIEMFGNFRVVDYDINKRIFSYTGDFRIFEKMLRKLELINTLRNINGLQYTKIFQSYIDGEINDFELVISELRSWKYLFKYTRFRSIHKEMTDIFGDTMTETEIEEDSLRQALQNRRESAPRLPRLLQERYNL